jgi:hypothetical protein
MDNSPNGSGGQGPTDQDATEVKRTLLAGLIGAVAGAAGYLIYSRLEQEQRDQIRKSVSKFFEDKIADIRELIKL